MTKSAVKRLRQIIADDNHNFFAKFFKYSGPLWAVLYIAFYLLLNYELGYRESLELRLIAAVLFCSMFFTVDANRPLSKISNYYIDCVLTFGLPFVFSAHLALNPDSSYWQQSLSFSAIAYGIFARSKLSLLLFPTVSILALTIYCEMEYFKQSVLTILIGTVINLLMGSARVFFLNALSEIKDLKRIVSHQKTITTFVRPSILAEIERGEDPLTYNDRVVKKAVMMVDIVGYTSISERIGDHELYELLNVYFTIINEAVFLNNGEVDKYIGDAAMALFDSPHDALSAGQRLLSTHEKLQQERRKAELETFDISLGFSYGEMLSANFGSELKMDRTVVGDTVNVCARIEGLTRVFGVQCLASEDIIAALKLRKEGLRPLTYAFVKGRSVPVKIFEIYSHLSSDAQKLKDETIPQLERIMTKAKRSKIDWEDHFEEAVELVLRENQVLPAKVKKETSEGAA